MNTGAPQGEPQGPEMTGDAALAMELALGVLAREERRAAQLRMAREPAFRAEVERWQALLAPLDGDTAPVAPPAGLWAAIEAETAPALAPAAAALPAKQSIWESLAFWRGMALAGPALAAGALVLLMPAPAPLVAPQVAVAAPPSLLAARLAAEDGTPLLAATYDPLRGTVVLTAAATRDDADLVPQLWVIEGSEKPRSLGVITLGQPVALGVSGALGVRPGAILAVSLEPLGGSPTGQPTGPVVATGVLSPV